MAGVNKPRYYMFLLRSYPFCVARESRKVPARFPQERPQATLSRPGPARIPQGSRKRSRKHNPNERLVTEYLAPLMC